jgi:hypothetical protein
MKNKPQNTSYQEEKIAVIKFAVKEGILQHTAVLQQQ